MDNAVKLMDVEKSFRDAAGAQRTVLKTIAFSLPFGQTLRLDGPSGTGKSTLLNIISGLLLPDRGLVMVAGQKLAELSEAARDRFRAAHMGYVFQTFNLLSPLTVQENVMLPPSLAGVKPVGAQQAREVLQRLGLGDHLNKRPYQLSVGQRQRVAVARALVTKPRILLADEPTASLDRRSAEVVIDVLAELKAAGTTLIVASHDGAIERLGIDQVVTLGAEEGAA